MFSSCYDLELLQVLFTPLYAWLFKVYGFSTKISWWFNFCFLLKKYACLFICPFLALMYFSYNHQIQGETTHDLSFCWGWKWYNKPNCRGVCPERLQHWVSCRWFEQGEGPIYYSCLWNRKGRATSCGTAQQTCECLEGYNVSPFYLLEFTVMTLASSYFFPALNVGNNALLLMSNIIC